MSFNTTRVPGLRKGRSTFEEFDALPREVRDAINYSTVKWATRGLHRHLKSLGVMGLVEAIKRADQKVIVMLEEQREADDFLKGVGL